MSRYIVTAEASPLFQNFLMVVSVSNTDGVPVTGLKAGNFGIFHLASLNHASPDQRTVSQVGEGPPGFYIIQLKPSEIQPNLPPGHYVFGVVVARTEGIGRAKRSHNGQTVAVGDLPA